MQGIVMHPFPSKNVSLILKARAAHESNLVFCFTFTNGVRKFLFIKDRFEDI